MDSEELCQLFRYPWVGASIICRCLCAESEGHSEGEEHELSFKDTGFLDHQQIKLTILSQLRVDSLLGKTSVTEISLLQVSSQGQQQKPGCLPLSFAKAHNLPLASICPSGLFRILSPFILFAITQLFVSPCP